MQAPEVSVVLITERHRYTCAILAAGRRLLDILNDRLTDYLWLEEVRVAWGDDPDQFIATVPRACLRKQALRAAVITSEVHEAPQSRLISYVPKIRRPVFLTLPALEVRGTLHLSAWAEPLDTLDPEKGEFFPVTGATLSWGGAGGGSLAAPVALIRKAWVELFWVGEARGERGM